MFSEICITELILNDHTSVCVIHNPNEILMKPFTFSNVQLSSLLLQIHDNEHKVFEGCLRDDENGC